MKKVGVVTLTGGANFGNKLQHYAVLNILEKLGYDAVTVEDVTRVGFKDPVNKIPFYKKLNIKYIRDCLSSRLQYKYHRKNESDGVIKCILREKKMHSRFVELEKLREQRFDKFAEKFLKYSDVKASATTRIREEIIDSYYAFVCGSDQVWNPLYRDFSAVRMLGFAPKEKRIAISPSFGVSRIPESRKDFFIKYLNEFAALSVREETGKKIIKELINKDVQVLIDPTLMLDSSEWDKIATKPEELADEPFLLTYFLGNKTRFYQKAIEKIASQKGLRIVDLFEIDKPEHYLYNPSEFLWLVKNAEFICTDSFHGTVFSILYKKDFFTFLRSESGFDSDNRVATLLKKLDLMSCIYKGENFCPINYDKVNEALLTERNEFYSYLKNALSNIEKSKSQEYTNVSQLNTAIKDNCNGCSACMNICPASAITMEPNDDGFLYPNVVSDKCISCGKCVEVCKNTNIYPKDIHSQAYATYNKDDFVREKSSSGGVFYALAVETIKNGGVVYGAAFDDNFKLIHTAAKSEEDIFALMGSKYLQSDISNCLAEVKNALEQNISVLFVGTPCQVNGLKAYLGKEYANLTTVDIICHGTPSQKAFNYYLSDICHEKNSIDEISFRNKDLGWANFSMKIKAGSKIYRKDLQHDPYLVAFLNDANLRDSCYNCRFKTIARNADLTIADFWGASKVEPSFSDDKGISLLLVHTEKGKERLRLLKKHLIFSQVDIQKATANNTAATQSPLKPKARENFYKEIAEKGFIKTVKLLYPFTLKKFIYIMKEKAYKLLHS